MIKPGLSIGGRSVVASQDRVESALRRFGFALAAHASDRLLELNLTIPQLRIIRNVDRLGRASGRQLADVFGVSPAAIVPVCDRLEAMGFLRRVRDTEDRRICWFELTESGAGTLDLVSTTIAANIKPALAALSYRDKETLAGILDTLTRVLTADQRSGA
jgi:DNA-binding MarR family transcriptional regulator